MRILIIDADPDLRSLLGHYIKQRWADWTVDEYDPLERNFPAEHFPLGDYQALILDYMLGRGDGLEWLQHLKKRHDCPKILFLTGAGNEIIAVRAMKAGADDYQRKQELTREKLLTSLHELTAGSKERTLSPELASRMEGHSIGAKIRIPGIKVLRLICEGRMARVYLASRAGEGEPLVGQILRREGHRGGRPHAPGRGPRYAALHEPGAGTGQGARPAHRHLQCRRPALPDAHRAPPLRWRNRHGGGDAASQHAAAGAARAPRTL